MFIRFNKDIVETVQLRDPWGHPRTLSPADKVRMREGLRFMRWCYYALIALFMLSASMLIHLLCIPK
jgi:hypothetical protein